MHKFALVRERKVDWENRFGAIGTKEKVPIKIKKQLMSNEKFCTEKYDIIYKQVSLKLCDNDFPTLDHNDLMDHVFILCCM